MGVGVVLAHLGGLVMAAIAALGGFSDFFGDQRIRDISDACGTRPPMFVVVLIELFSVFYRHENGAPAAAPFGLSLSLVSVVLLLFSGWKGGELVYKHRVAVKA